MTRTTQPGTPTKKVADTRRRETKVDILRRLLARKAGADLDALCTATGWQDHSVRAALSGIRKAGFALERSPARPGGGTAVYRITAAPAPAS